MKRKKLGNTGIEVTEVGFGVLPVGPHQKNLSPEDGGAVLAYALKRGINFIDTAQYYLTYPHIRWALNDYFKSIETDDLTVCGDASGPFDNTGNASASFDSTGNAYASFDSTDDAYASFDSTDDAVTSHFAANRVDRPVIVSKSLVATYNAMEEAVIEAIEAFGYVDIFLLHEVRPGDFETRQGAWRFLQDAKAEGIIRAIGISTHHVDVVLAFAEIPECDIVFPLINYAGLGIRNGDGPGSREDMEAAIALCKARGKGVFTMKAFGGGPLIKEYSQCLEYSLGLEDSASTMIGFASFKDVDDLFDFLDGKVPNIDSSQKIMHIEKGSCEACGACLRRCANGAIFFSQEDGLAEIDYARCMTCGYCVPACPVRAIILY